MRTGFVVLKVQNIKYPQYSINVYCWWSVPNCFEVFRSGVTEDPFLCYVRTLRCVETSGSNYSSTERHVSGNGVLKVIYCSKR
jgi:hypothetical protein